MENERSSSPDHEQPSLGPRIAISDEERQTAVDRSDSDSVASQRSVTENDNDVSHLHVPVSVKGHSPAIYCPVR